MYLGENHIPQQKLSKTKKNKQWKEACVKAYIDLSESGGGISQRKDYLKRLYDYYNGIIDGPDYDYVLKPYGKTRKNFPSKMRNYPIIKPILDLLLGEQSKRPLNYTVTVQNSDTISLKEEAKSAAVMKSMEQHFINAMNEAGAETGMPSDEKAAMPDHVAKQFEDSYVDNRAIKGQYALNYIMQEQELEDKFRKAWFDFLVTGECYTHRGVRNAEPFYEVLNPLNVDYDLDPDLEFVEDGDWAMVKKYVHASTVIDHFHNDLSDEQVLSLEQPRHEDIDAYLTYGSSDSASRDVFRSRLLEVTQVYWKSRKKIGFLKYMDPETGAMEEMEVEEGYKISPELAEANASIDWKWVNEVWEGTRIDGRMYINIHPCVNQRVSLDNPSTCKLPINGRRYSDRNTENISLVSLGIPYQLNYNIYKYRLELAIARSKDIVAQFDINMIPKKWDMDKFMYYVEGTGIAWVDYNKEGIQLSPQHQSVLDMSIKTIEQYIVLLNSIMEEWEKLSGVNRQRQGQVGEYEGKASSQQAIVQSSHITEDIFKKFARLQRRDLQAMIDYSKEAWLTGKKSMYMMPDGTAEFLDLDSMEHMESEYGIFVSNAGKDQDKLQAIRELSQAMVQNGLPISAVAEMIDTDNFTKIKSNIKSAEKSQQELEQQQKQSEQEMQQQMQQAQLQAEQAKLENDNMNRDKDRQVQLEIAHINNSDNMQSQAFDMQKSMKDFELKERQLNLKEEELNEKRNTNSGNRASKEVDQQLKQRDQNIKKDIAKSKDNNPK
tara:strand:+ start:204 stop:2522 length:2319 start_codon:yes stop_codon:yes gene_type:complete